MTRPVVFIPEPIADCGIALLEDSCEFAAPWREGRDANEDELRALFRQADASITRLFPVRGEDIEGAPNLKVIGRHGVGVDMVDCEAAAARRIPIVITPEANSNAVAEHAVALMMACAKQLVAAHQAVVSGNFADRVHIKGVELAGKTLGLIGLGRIGTRVARLAAGGFGMRVVAYDPLVDVGTYDGPATIESSLDTVLQSADFLSLHVPLIEATKNLISAERMERLKPGCCVINTARGGIIDESALVRALESGTVSAAGIDALEREPVTVDDPLCSAPNTILSPHTATSTREALENMARDAAQGVLDVLQGRKPQWVANPEVFDAS